MDMCLITQERRDVLIEGYLSQRLSELRMVTFEQHYFTCPECAEALKAAVQKQEYAMVHPE